MLSDRLADPPTLLMATVMAAYGVIVVRLAVREAERARRRRAAADWRTMPQTRIARRRSVIRSIPRSRPHRKTTGGSTT